MRRMQCVTTVLSMMLAAVSAQINMDNCDVLYECWAIDSGGTVAWRSMPDLPGWVDIQISRPDTGDYSTPQYAAIGFSSDRSMGDDPVTECVFDGDHASVHLSYNDGHSNVRLPQDIADAQTKLVESRRSNGELYCRLQQRVTAMQDVSGVYDLNKEYQLLYAMGEAATTNIKQHKLRQSFGKLVDITSRQFPNAPQAGPVAAPVNGMGLPSPPHIDDAGLPPLSPIEPIVNNHGALTPNNVNPEPPPLPEPEPEPESEPDNNTIDKTDHANHNHHAHAEPSPEPNHIEAHSEPSGDNASSTIVVSLLILAIVTINAL